MGIPNVSTASHRFFWLVISSPTPAIINQHPLIASGRYWYIEAKTMQVMLTIFSPTR
jgi:hypothetical protein